MPVNLYRVLIKEAWLLHFRHFTQARAVSGKYGLASQTSSILDIAECAHSTGGVHQIQ